METDLTEEVKTIVRLFGQISLDFSSHLRCVAATPTLDRVVCVQCAETILLQLINCKRSLKQLRFEFKLQYISQKVEDQAEEGKNSRLVLV